MRDLTLISATLQRLHEIGKLSVQLAADKTGVDTSSIYRWISGECEPGAESVARLARCYPDPDVAMALGDWLLRSTGIILTHIDPDLDVNGDGQIDMDDALAAAIGTIKVTGAMLDELHKRPRKNGHRITGAEVAQMDETCCKAHEAIEQARGVIHFLHEQQSTRRKARPFRVAGGARRSYRHRNRSLG